MKAFLFLLFPEYKDPENHTHAFLETDTLRTNNELKVYLEKLYLPLLFFSDEGVTFLYDNKNLEAFLFPVTSMPDEYPNYRRYQLELIERRMQQWRANSEQEASDVFFFLGCPIADNTLSEISKRQYNNHLADVVYAAVDHEAISSITSKRERVSVNCNGREKSFSVIKLDVDGLMTWLKEKGIIKRIYVPNSDKHGSNGRGGLQAANVSRLLCTDEEAKIMMKKAFKYGKHLYFFDMKNEKYIKFMSGNNNTFHPYHIMSLQDENNIIKNDVKRVLKLLFGTIRPQY